MSSTRILYHILLDSEENLGKILLSKIFFWFYHAELASGRFFDDKGTLLHITRPMFKKSTSKVTNIL